MESMSHDFNTFTQGNLDAILRANAAFTKGVGQLSKNFFAVASRSVEEAAEATKRLASVKSFEEAFEIQTTFAQHAIDNMIAETTRAQELSASIAKECSAPITERSKASIAAGVAAIQAATTSVTPVSQTKKAAA